jgi:hypothetical protein
MSTAFCAGPLASKKKVEVEQEKVGHVGLANQSLSFKGTPGDAWDLMRRTEIMPVKDSHTRIKPLALASGQGRYITGTHERTLVSVGEWPLHIAVINL